MQTPRQALNKAFLKVKPSRKEIETFKANLKLLLNQINETESEEFHKNLVSDFLKNTYYSPNYFINTKGRKDLVIHNGKKAKDTVGVIIEAKKPTNKGEMVSPDSLNKKALQELILYYLRERITEKNLEIKQLIITNIYEWFVFDAQTFDKLFVENKKLVKQFQAFESKQLSGTNTDFFYKEIAAPLIETLHDDIPFTYFDLRKYERPLRNDSPKDDRKLISLFKLLSPEHLLKLPFANDSNSLDKRFYSELLHIIGLDETKEKGKKIIGRAAKNIRNEGSLLENTIIQLDSHHKLSRISQPSQYGINQEERLFNVALELVITWMNRLLFLKLLEAQLLSYHKGDEAYAFLNSKKLHDFDDVDKLFFRVLAKQYSDRSSTIQKLFHHVPYLNSSLFEPTELEHQTLFISGLEDRTILPIHSQSVLKDNQGKRLSAGKETLAYLFEFLDAYDFSSEGAEEIQEENKTLINASVLGLIFEKINGYKDGSFFTPGFITEYMCRETIRKAVSQKFREAEQENIETYEDVKAYTHRYFKQDDILRFNKIINSLTICDPAVGSGHFLVSALNELVAIKSDLGILADQEGIPLKIDASVVNDELVISDSDSNLFTYNNKDKESQRTQKAIFHEKQTLIENCLFGVDINPNSVKICRLRLWIELLKHTYYKNDTELETLPNIDINIKCGNSLISRFALDSRISEALKRSSWKIADYKACVQGYKQAQNKEDKQAFVTLIEQIKGNFETEISKKDKRVLRHNKLTGELYNLLNQGQLFDLSKAERKVRDKQRASLEKKIKTLQTEIDEIKDNKIYENAFEWRFEFPEVLNEEGDFVGFDVLIGNPPYMRVQEIQKTQPLEKKYYEETYSIAKGSYDLANIFFELAVNISAPQSDNAYIFPHKFFNSASTAIFRDYLVKGRYIDKIAHFGANMVFEDADTYTCVARFSKQSNEGFSFQRFPFKSDFQRLLTNEKLYAFINYERIIKASDLYGSNQWILFDNEVGSKVFEKIYIDSNSLEAILEGIFVGLQTSKDDLYVVEGYRKNDLLQITVPSSQRTYLLEHDLFKPFLKGRDLKRYAILETTNQFVFFPYKLENGDAKVISIKELKENFPFTYEYLIDHESDFKRRESGKAGKKEFWYAHGRENNLSKFEQPKLSSMEICSKHPNVIFNQRNLYHSTTVYSWVKKMGIPESYEYLLAIANSKLFWWFLKLTGDTLQGDARRLKTNYLNPFPIPKSPNLDLVNQIENQVANILILKEENLESDTNQLESEIDQLLYKVYGLNEEEVAIVEELGNT